jgi:energy-coupling factor transporter ATP-binding protein EcfA2
MKVKKIIALSWGLVQDREYDMGDATMLSGPTGAGKSTLIDALQTVMTAARQGAFSYNPGQDETSQNSRSGKSKRTLASYIVGAEDNLFARPQGAHGYVGIVFCPSEGEEGPSFTSVMACEATVENGPGGRRTAVQERLMFLTIENSELCAEDFQIVAADGTVSRVPVENIYIHLKKKYGAENVANFADNKGEFLRRQYGLFRGLKFVSLEEALHAAKSWSSSIAYRPIGSVDELIKHQVLEEQNLVSEVSKISEMMRTVTELRREAERMAAVIEALDTLDASGEEALTRFQDVVKLQSLSALKGATEIEQAVAHATTVRDTALAEVSGAEAADIAAQRENTALQSQLVELIARRSNNTLAAEKDQLDQAITLGEKNVLQKIGNVHSVLGTLKALVAIAEDGIDASFADTSSELQMARMELKGVLEEVKALNLDGLAQSVINLSRGKLSEEALTTLSAALEKLDVKAQELKGVLSDNEGSFAEVVEQTTAQMSAKLVRDEEALREKTAKAQNLSSGGANYPSHIQSAITHLEDAHPGIKVEVLCDLIKPKSAEWQNTIEGFMGGDRFALFVDAKYEERATRTLKGLSRRGSSGASVVQASKVVRDAERLSLKSGSILEELVIDHDVAYAYMLAKYGSTLKVADTEALRQAARGVTRDGFAASGYKMYSCGIDDGELLFGADAKRNAAERLKKDVLALSDTILEARRTQEALKKLTRAARSATYEATTPYARDAVASYGVVTQQKRKLAAMDFSEIASLEEEKQALEVRLQTLAKESNGRHQSIGGLRTQITDAENKLAHYARDLTSKQDAVVRARVELEKLCAMDQAVSFEAVWQTLADEAKDSSVTGSAINSRINQAGQKLVAAHSEFCGELARYNEKVRPGEQISYVPAIGFRGTADSFWETYPLLMESLSMVKAQLRQQREVGIADSVERLKQAEAEFNDVFTCQFCYKVKSKVDTGVSTLKALNRELQTTPFGPDRYRIDWDWVPEYKKFYDFFTALNAMGDAPTGDLFGAMKLPPEQEKVREELKNLLLDGNEEKAVKRLAEISDYRNYRVYDVWKESDSGSKVRLSQWGTGSGGQLETPAYIIRAAILSHALKHFTAKGPHLRLMVNDESFSKMDETRARAVIHYLNQTLGFQLISAMPTRSGTSLKDEFSREFSFSRMDALGMGEVNAVSQAQEKILNKDALRTLWDRQREEVRTQAALEFDTLEAKQAA